MAVTCSHRRGARPAICQQIDPGDDGQERQQVDGRRVRGDVEGVGQDRAEPAADEEKRGEQPVLTGLLAPGGTFLVILGER